MSSYTLIPLLALAIPLFGILLAGYKEWLNFKAKQQQLGASTQEVEETIQTLRDRLDQMEQERDALITRIQNLETIVTSEAWDALKATEDDALPEASPPSGLELPSAEGDADDTTQDQAEKLARRLRS